MKLGVVFIIGAIWMWYVVVTGVFEIRELFTAPGGSMPDSIEQLRGDAASAATLTPTASATPTPEPTAEPGRHHTVVSGDTMARIAQRYQVTLQRLIAANPAITDPARIEVGQRISIPD
jgi:LysM repeat protein